MRRTLLAVASPVVFSTLLVLIGIGLTACTVQQVAPTPNVEEIAKAIANTWATQTAVAATAGVPATATAAAQVAPTQLAATAVSPAPGSPAPATAAAVTPMPATQAPLPSATSAPATVAAATATNTPAPTRTLPPTSTPRPFKTLTPGPTSAVACAIAVNPELVGSWNRATLGCPVEDPAVVWAAWEPFQRGMMLWRSDKDETYALLFGNGADINQGSVINGGDAWRWDNSSPNGHGLTPPAGFYEPVRGFGYVWYNFLGGQKSLMGWATQPEQGICVTRQTFEGGVLIKSSMVNTCQDNLLNMASSSSFTPLALSIGNDGQWQRR